VPSPALGGIDQLRATAKWLVAAFGALGAALIASVQLRDLGGLTGGDRTRALVGFALGIAGVLIALLAATSVLSAKSVELTELSERSKSAPHLRRWFASHVSVPSSLLGGYDTIDTLRSDLVEASRERIDAYRERLNPADSAAYDAASRRYAVANLRLQLVAPVVAPLLEYALFERVRSVWRRVTLPGVVLGVTLATIGTALFVTSLGEKENEPVGAVAARPVQAVMDLSPDGEAKFSAALGGECDPTAVAVIVLASSDDGWDVVTADETCASLRLDVSSEDGAVTSCEWASSLIGDTTNDETSDGSGERPASSTPALAATESTSTTVTTTPLPQPPAGGPCHSWFVR
jgi:hypothetical protein